MPRSTLPPLNAVRAFECAGRHSSFLRAAEELGVTPGAVSRQIKTLEDHLGTALFERRHRQIVLTGPGRQYHREIREALALVSAATDSVRSPARRASLSVCSHPTFAIRWLVPLWSRFYDRHPEIDLQLTTSLSPVDFDRDPFDACVRVGTGRWPGCRSLHLTEVDLFPICSPALGQRIGSLTDLANVTLIHSAPRPDDWKRWLQDLGDTSVDASRGPVFESLNLAFQAAIEGVGVAMGIGALVADDLASGRLVAPFDHVRRSASPFWLVWPERKDSNPLLRAFVAWLAEEVDRRQGDEKGWSRVGSKAGAGQNGDE